MIHKSTIDTVFETARLEEVIGDFVQLKKSGSNFKGLKNLTRNLSDGYYRYYYERTANYSKAKSFLKKAQNNGFKDAIIVAFKNDNKISINDYLSQDTY